MQVKLELDIDRYSPKDRGFFLDLVGSEAWGQRQDDLDVFLERNSLLVMLDPVLDFNSEPKSAFTLEESDDWEEIADCWMFEGLGLHHRKLVRTQPRYTAALEKNQVSLVGLQFAKPTDYAPIELRWGIQYDPVEEKYIPQLKLILEPGKRPRAKLLNITADIPEFPYHPEMVFEMSDGPILDADALYGRAFSVLCMPLRHRLCLYSDLWDDWFIIPDWETKPSWIDPGPPERTHYYCLRDGQFGLDATAIFYLSFRPLTYATAGQFDIPFELDYTPTEMPTYELDWEFFSGTGAALTILRNDGTPYQLGDTEGKARVSMIGDGDHTPLLNKLLVRWEPSAEFREGDPVAPDVLSLRENLSADPGADSIECTIRPGAGEQGLWKRPNLPFKVTVDGDTIRMLGFGDKPTLIEDGPVQTYETTLRSGWKRLEHAILGQVQCQAYDGMIFSDAITRLLYIAGVDDTEIHVTADETPLPAAEKGKEPLYQFGPGMTVADAIEQLRDEWNGDWVMYHGADGFHIEPAPDPTPAYTFVRAAPGADPDQIVRDLHVWSDDTYFVNYLVVWGLDEEGKPIHSDPLVDSDSINTPGAPDYVGELRALILLNSSANTVEKCDLIAEKLWSVWNNIPRFVRWRGPFVKTLYPHQSVLIQDVGGDPAEDIVVRILEMRTEFVPNLGLTDYYGEVIP